MFPDNPQNFNPSHTARFWENLWKLSFYDLNGRKYCAASPFGETLLARSSAHSVLPPWDCLWFVALWPTFVKLKMCFGPLALILSRSVTARLPQQNIHHWKGNMVTFNRIFWPYFILDLWMIILLHLWNRTTFCLLRMVVGILAWKTTIIFTLKVNWGFVSPY